MTIKSHQSPNYWQSMSFTGVGLKRETFANLLRGALILMEKPGFQSFTSIGQTGHIQRSSPIPPWRITWSAQETGSLSISPMKAGVSIHAQWLPKRMGRLMACVW